MTKPPSKEDIKRALDQTDREGMPRNRRSTKYCLVARKCHYPPKLILGRAIGSESPIPGVGGGLPTNRLLKKRGYQIVRCGCGNEGVTISN